MRRKTDKGPEPRCALSPLFSGPTDHCQPPWSAREDQEWPTSHNFQPTTIAFAVAAATVFAAVSAGPGPQTLMLWPLARKLQASVHSETATESQARPVGPPCAFFRTETPPGRRRRRRRSQEHAAVHAAYRARSRHPLLPLRLPLCAHPRVTASSTRAAQPWNSS